MLASLRKSAGSWFVKIFLMLLGLSFVAWGVGDFARDTTDRTVATVGDVEISALEFDSQFRRELQRLQQQLGSAIDTERARQLGLVDASLQQMVSRSLLDQAAAQFDLVASDATVAEQIRSNPAFRNSLGQFDRFIFEQTIANQGWNEATFVELTRRDMVREQLIASILAGVDRAPENLVQTILQHREQRRLAEVAMVPPPSAPLPEPDQATLEAFHGKNAARFTAPEFRAISYVALSPDDVLDEITVPEQEVRDEYEANREAYTTPEKRTVQQIVYADQAAAQAAYDTLRDGRDFATVAKESRGLEPGDLSLGTVTRNELPPVLADSAFALPADGISEPVQSPLGWHILRVTAILPGSSRSFDEVKDELRRELALRQAGDALYRMANRLQDEIAGGADLRQAAAAVGLELHAIPAIDANGRGPDGKPVEGLPAAQQLLSHAFDAPAEAEPELIETSEGGYLMVRVDAVTPPVLRPLAEIRDQVLAAWQHQERQRLAAERAQELALAVRQGGNLAELAAAAGTEVRTIGPFTRTGSGAAQDLSPSLVAALFGAKQGEVVTAPGSGDAQAVARLTQIQEPDPEAAQAMRQRIARATATGIADDVLSQYREALARDLGVTVNRDVLDTLF